MKHNNSTERKLLTVVESKDADSRFDKWLTERFTYHSRNQWQEIIKKGLITVNGKRCRASKLLRIGDVVEFNVDGYEEPEVNFEYNIVYEDETMFAVNKPSNLPCHPAGIYYKNTLFAKISEERSSKNYFSSIRAKLKISDEVRNKRHSGPVSKETDSKIYLINRLDRETSGIVLFAKSSGTAAYLSNLFMIKQISKEYVVIVHGVFPEKLNAVGYLTCDDKSPVRKKRKFITEKTHKENPGIYNIADLESAETIFELIKSNNTLSLVKVLPATGRLHQIRATLCSLGYPVVGDKLYGLDDTLYLRFIDGKLSNNDKCKLILDRQALHAKSLSFMHPDTEKQIAIETSIPDDFKIL